MASLHSVTMTLWSLAILLQVVLLVQAQDLDALREALDKAGVKAVFPEDAAYANASVACKWHFALLQSRIPLSLPQTTRATPSTP